MQGNRELRNSSGLEPSDSYVSRIIACYLCGIGDVDPTYVYLKAPQRQFYLDIRKFAMALCQRVRPRILASFSDVLRYQRAYVPLLRSCRVIFSRLPLVPKTWDHPG